MADLTKLRAVTLSEFVRARMRVTSTYSMQYPPAEMVDGKSRKLSVFNSVYVSHDLLPWLPPIRSEIERRRLSLACSHGAKELC